MFDVAVLLLAIFTVIASVDGFYFHLHVYRLHQRPASRREHALHTANAILFPLTLAPVFLADASGAWLWVAVALHAAVLAIEVVDVLIEPASRADLGGLTGVEASMHFLMSGLRWAFVALVFASIPGARWGLPAELVWRSPFEGPASFVPWVVALTGVPVALLHVVLALPPARVRPAAA